VCGTVPLKKLEAAGLTCTDPSSGWGIRAVSLCLWRGSFTVIAGGHGAGKSTLLRALCGQLPLEGGEIRWNGAPVAEPRSFFAPPHSIYLAQARAEDAQAGREGLARLLEGQAELLVVDDLSAVLSAQEERAWWDALFCQRLFRRQATCLAVSNRQAALSRADHILVLRQGRIAGEGRLAALLQSCAEMRRVFVG
jgi:ATP-binding cassette subfamily B protein